VPIAKAGKAEALLLVVCFLGEFTLTPAPNVSLPKIAFVF
jgi:hypothetical protein